MYIGFVYAMGKKASGVFFRFHETSCILRMKRFITFRTRLLFIINREAADKILGGVHVI